MNKKQLLEKLEKVSDETEIIVSSDGEGNSYRKLGEVSNEDGLKYIKQDYEIVLIDKNAVEEDYVTQTEYDKAKNCVVLYP